jgi:hypothetical protein
MSNEKLPAIVSDALSRLEELKVSPVNLSPQYLRMEKGEHRKVVFISLDTDDSIDPDTGELVRGKTFAKFVAADGQTYISSSSGLVAAVADLESGTPLQITYGGKEDIGGGRSLNRFLVQLLIA